MNKEEITKYIQTAIETFVNRNDWPSTTTKLMITDRIQIKYYYPLYFKQICEMEQAPCDLRTICSNEQLQSVASPGKSGAQLWFSNVGENRFVLKTLTTSEGKQLQAMLNSYTDHLRSHNSLLCRFFLFFRIQKNLRIVVMNNVFNCEGISALTTYDLKGSLIDRKATDEEAKRMQFKDQDIIRQLNDGELRIQLDKSTHENLIAQIERDAHYLKSHRIMDYSLVIGLCQEDGEHGSGRRGLTRINSLDGKVLYLGIIDILQVFNVLKRAAMVVKAVRYPTKLNQLSTVPPQTYSTRFVQFSQSLFSQ